MQISHPAFAHVATDAKSCMLHALRENATEPKNLTWLTATPEAREQFKKLKVIWGGRYPPEIAAAIEHAEPEMGPIALMFTSPKSLLRHFAKHGEKDGFKTEQAYEEAAVGFANRKSSSAFVITREPGVFIKYDLVTHEFVIVTEGGRIITYFVSELNPIYTLNYALCQYVQGDVQRQDCVRAAWNQSKLLQGALH